MDVEEFENLKRKYEKRKKEKTEMEGALKSELQRLKEEFDFDTLENAKNGLNSLKKEFESISDKLKKKYKKFKTKYEKLL